MMDDKALREKPSKVEALFRRAASPGEKAAAGAAMDRLHDRLGSWDRNPDPEEEYQYSLPDTWSVRLFIAICRKHGVHPYRYARQRRTTVLVRVRKREFDRVVWQEFSRLHSELEDYFEAVTDHLITRAMGSDGDDSTIDQRRLPG